MKIESDVIDIHYEGVIRRVKSTDLRGHLHKYLFDEFENMYILHTYRHKRTHTHTHPAQYMNILTTGPGHTEMASIKNRQTIKA